MVSINSFFNPSTRFNLQGSSLKTLLLRFNIIIFLLAANLASYGQEGIIKLTGLLEASSSVIPDDQVFIHTDRNLYHPDDTIFFQSYVRNRFTRIHETSSLSLYVILYDTEGIKIDSARFRIDHSLAPGYLKIPNYIAPGYYRLVAFTSNMLDFDPGYAFISWIRIDEVRSDALLTEFSFDRPFYGSGDTAEINVTITDKLNEPLKNESFIYSLVLDGESQGYYNSKTNRNGESLLRIYLPDSIKYRRLSLEVSLKEKNHLSRITIPRDTDLPDLRFLPEGGTFIANQLQRLAFNAVTDNGKQLFVSGTIKDDLGQVTGSFKSGSLGPGIIEFKPSQGRLYHAVLEGYPGVKFPLPEPASEGISLRVEVSRNLVNVQLNVTGEPLDSCFLVLSMNGDALSIQPLPGKEGSNLKFDAGRLPPGTLKITLYDEYLNPYSERLVLINSHQEILPELDSRYEFYVGGQESELEISLKDNEDRMVAGIFSIAVIDSLTAFYSDLPWLNIKEYFLFDPDFYSNLPGKIRQTGLSNIAPGDLDLLLMTYGWRKFNLVNIDQTARTIEEYDLLRVKIIDRMTRRRTRRVDENKDNLVVMTVEYPGIYSLITDQEGSYYFPLDSISPGNSRIIVAPANRAERYINGIKVEFRDNPSYIESLGGSMLTPPLTLKDDFSLTGSPELEPDSIRRIGEVDVWGRRKRETDNTGDFIWKYQTVSSRTLDQEDLKYAVSFDQLLRKLNPLFVDVGSEQIFFRPQQSLLGGPTMPPALFVLDGFPIGNNYSIIANMNPRDIYFITAVKGSQGFYLYGERANGGVVFIETKVSHFGGTYELDDSYSSSFRGDLSRPVEIFRPSVEFYSPPSELVANDPAYWLRSTIFWDHEVFCDGKTPTKIKYFNHLKKGPALIIINGVSIDNQPIAGRFRYLIR